MSEVVYVVCYEPYHDNSEVTGVFTTRELAVDYLTTLGTVQPDGDDGWYEIAGSEYWSITQVQLNEHSV